MSFSVLIIDGDLSLHIACAIKSCEMEDVKT